MLISTNNIEKIGGGAIYIHRADELTIQKIVGSTIEVIDASVSAQEISDDINMYTVEGIDIYITPERAKFEPYRFAYVNNWGGTDYINFSLADAENLKISKSMFENDNKDIVYNVDVEQKFTCYSDVMTEEQSKNLRWFWISPKIELIKDGTHYPVNIASKSEEVKNRESGLIFYDVTFTYESKFNVQK